MDGAVLRAGEEVVCASCAIAETALARMRGLLGRRSFDSGEGLLLRPAASVHTAFMRFPIDVVFLDRDLHVLKVARSVPPWRMVGRRGAKAVLELPAGEAARRRLSPGVELFAPESEVGSRGSGRWRAAQVSAAAVLGALALARFGTDSFGIFAALFAAVLGVLSVIDLERRLILNRIVLPAAVVTLLAQLALFPQHAAESALAAAGASAFLMLLAVLRPGGLGMGDVKLGLLLGAGLGQGVIGALALGFIASWPVALFLVLRHGRAALKRHIAFGPLLSVGALLVLFARAPFA